MTEKKMKRHLKRIWYHYARLRAALNDAHNAEVIEYEGDYKDVAPCWAADELRDRIEATTNPKLAKTIQYEMRASVRSW